MNAGDARRRLKLVGGHAPVPPFARRVRPPGRAIGIAEVVPGESALAWSVELARSLALFRPVCLVACAFGEAPELGSVIGALVGASVRPLAWAVDAREDGLGSRFPELGELAGDELWVCVGEPAVALLEPHVAVLLGTDAPLSRWLPSLQPWSGAVNLSLTTARPSLAPVLARALAAH